MNLSQTQLANIATLAGILAIVLQKMGIVIPESELSFILAAVWSLGWTAYNYYQRYKKGDVNVFGVKV